MNKQIVFIDDEKDICEAIQDLFFCPDYDLRCFSDPNKGLDYILKNKNIYCVFCDYNMPNMSGVELANKIPREIRVVMISGDYPFKKNLPDRFWSIIRKPFDDSELVKVLDEISSSECMA